MGCVIKVPFLFDAFTYYYTATISFFYESRNDIVLDAMMS